MRDRIDISEVEARTKIRAKYLRAIENEEWDLLPGPIYAKSFLRTYGDFLGLDSRMLLDEFKRRYEYPSDHDARPIGSIAARDRDRRPPRRLPGWAPIAIVVVLIVAILFVVGSLGSTTTNTTPRNPPAHPRSKNRVKPAKPVTAARPATATLKLVPTAAVYVCLVNGRGTKLIDEQTFNVGEAIPTETARKLLLTLGNASVQMKVNGKSVPVSPSATAIRMLITPTAITPISSSKTPTCP
jgi:cytoskeleton protein RodZ